MISDKSSLANRLGWIMEDVEDILNRIREACGRYYEDANQGNLATARETCRQLKGVLEILDANGAQILCNEIINLLDALLQNRVENLAAAKDALAEGLLQLSAYLKHLQEGYANLPVIILPTLNNLRAAAGTDLLSEHLIFLPETGHASDDAIGVHGHIALPAAQLQTVTTKLRFYWQKALLAWFRNEQPAKMLQAVGKVADNMIRLNQTQRLRALWWISAAVAQALEQGKLEHSVAAKMLLGRLEREIRHFGEQGEERYNLNLKDDLLKNLLYYAGIAEHGAPLTDQVKAAYQLDLYLPRGETLEELRQHYNAPTRELWRAVAAPIIDDLRGLQSLLEGMQESTRQPEILHNLIAKTESLGNTLAMLGLNRAAERNQHFLQDLQARAASGEVQDLAAVLDISTHYARLEKVMAEYADTGYDLTDSIFTAANLTHDPAGESSLLQTTLTELGKVQNRLISFYKEGWSTNALEEASAALDNIHGALGILGATELLPLVQVALRYTRDDLAASQRQPSPTELALFADILTLFEACVGLRLHHEDYTPLLPTGYAKLRELDSFSPADLLAGHDLAALEATLEDKKKVAPLTSQMLLQQLRQPPTRIRQQPYPVAA